MSIDSVNQATSAVYSASQARKDSTAYQTMQPHTDDDQKQPSDATASNAVTGTTGSNLSKEVIDQLIAEAQETGVSNANTDEYDGPLSIGERHHLEDIVNNPGYGASEAKMFGTSSELVFAYKTRAELMASITSNSDISSARLAGMEKVLGERTAYYESLAGQDLTPAEKYAKLLEFNANLPQSHDATLGWSESGQSMSYSDYNNARLDYLQSLINKNGPQQASKDKPDAALPVGTQYTPDEIAKATAPREITEFEKMNFVTESDRKLFKAMTGLNVGMYGKVTDNNGNPPRGMDFLANHSFVTFHMELQTARRGQGPQTIAGKDITEAEFMTLIQKSKAIVISMGEIFNEDLTTKGLNHIRSHA